jgi:glycosyltransferase involved in cell wall biosynthesis
MAFELDIFGSGSRGEPLREAVKRHGLEARVRINDPLHFEDELVPWMREHADLFLCCHPQSDPSCTYMETLGCGVPIAGFANRAWSGILEQAPVGWAVPIGDATGLARQVLALDKQRELIVAAAQDAISLAASHTFESTFERRVTHLLEVARTSSKAARP